ncbi:Helicase conserved C-terminal domain-containing protein [Haloechinothrix alba]|uniref:Helicase conserved C-terminal domain-containing protein n=1 Tax=Haloechinothrix alba TaxID=664784 RepID=A0A238XD14_9PSEU|nr:helicase-associated domain-containing protein [Haloechinothrix alba]SNR56403.1 Helicase conserved C-terminal domain-containing protein [Haloechinothrix alba]
MSATSLAHWLRSVSDDELARMLAARRDLATPPPADTNVLATRAGTAGSVARACEDLDTFTLAVLEALLVLDADAGPVTAEAVDELAGASTRRALTRLRRMALVWGDDSAVSTVPAAREVLGPYPAGLGRDVPELRGTDVHTELEALTQPERKLLDTLAAGPPVGNTKDAGSDIPLEQARTPVQSLLARGLLVRKDSGTVELPRQLGLAVRGKPIFPDAVRTEPAPETYPHTTETVDSTAAGEAMELNRHMESLLESWARTPPPVLKAGGLGVREVRRIARELEIDEARAVLLAELAYGADLVAESTATEPEWLLTNLADSWLGSPPAHRWAILATAWLDLPRLPCLAYSAAAARAGGTGEKDKQPAPLSTQLHKPRAATARRRALEALAELPDGTGIAGGEQLVTLLAWRNPRRDGPLRDEMVRAALWEASALGVVALGAVTSAARTLLEPAEESTGEPTGEAGDESAGESVDERRRRATAAMAVAMPAPVDHVLVQADLTIVAPGPLEPGLAAEITAVADVESAGHATVYRVTEDSVRRALDSGHSAEELHDLFARTSRTPVPQGLTYLIDDVARRHGRLRAGTCASFLRCDDEVVLAEILNSPAAGELDLRRVAPTVLVSGSPLAEVLDGLRERGFTPAAEGPDGRVLDVRTEEQRTPKRAPARRRAQGATGASGASTSERIADVVARIRSGDRAASTRRVAGVRNPGGEGDTSATLELLTRASLQRREVWIGLVDGHGTASQHIVTPTRVGGGVLEGDDNERYPLHRITSAAFVES